MELARLTVRNFRNLAALDLELPPRGVVIVGNNGQGKTNLLEAVYYLVLFRSFRGAKDRELVRFGENGYFLAGEADTRVTAGYDAPSRRKKVTVGGGLVDKLGEAVGRIAAVVFSPADRDLITGGPAGRRRYVDVVLALTSRGYLDALSALRAALRQRNAALRRGRPEAAWAFDAPFARAAATVVGARRAWIAAQQGRFTELCTALGEREGAIITYHARPECEHASEFEAHLAVARDRDQRRGLTTIGPHRDDVRLTLDGRDTRHFGSAGQQRTSAIALRLLEAESIRAAHGSAPIALFDDVFAELDATRQEHLLGLIALSLPGQALVTAPRDAEVPAALLDRPRWRMTGGTVER